MTDERRVPTDSQIEAGLARRAPHGADSDLLVSIVAAAERTGQVSTWWPPQRPSAMMPNARLAWIAILVALSLAIGGLIATGASRHGRDLGVTFLETSHPSTPPSPDQPSPPSPEPLTSPSPTPSSSPTTLGRHAPPPAVPSPCDAIHVVPASQAGPATTTSGSLTGDGPAAGIYITLTSPAVAPYADGWTTARGGELWVADGQAPPRRVAVIEGPRTTYPIVSDWSPDRSRALVAVAHGSPDGGKPDCVELFEVRIDDGAATRLWAETFNPGTWIADIGERGYVDAARLASGVVAEYSPPGDAISYAVVRGDPTTVGLVIDGADRTMRVQSAWAGAFASPGPRDVGLDRGSAPTSLACLSEVGAPGVWSPSGDRLALLCDGGVAIVDPVAGTGRAIRNGAQSIAWAPDGRLLVATTTGYSKVDIESIDPTSGAVSILGSGIFGSDGSSVGDSISFSPDGRTVLVDAAYGATDALAAMATTGGSPVPVLKASPGLSPPATSWSADSSDLVYVAPIDGSAQRPLTRVAVATRASTSLGRLPASYGSGVWRIP